MSTIHQIYFPKKLTEKVNEELSKCKMTKSKFIRQILKKEFNYCLKEDCYNPSYSDKLCFIHSKKLKEERGDDNNVR